MWKGIDVSDNQGAIDWAAVKNAGCEFAILRSVRRSGKTDAQFTANLQGCRQQQIPCSVYKYTYAVSEQAAEAEAAQVIALLQTSGLTCTVWWDVENREVLQPLGKDTLTACILSAQKSIEAAGFSFGIYTGLYVYREKWFDFGQFSCPLWIARYPSTKEKSLSDMPADKYLPHVGRPISGWQYSSNGKVAGIKTTVDLDISYLEPAVFSGQVTTDAKKDRMILLTGLTSEQSNAVRAMIQAMGITGTVYLGQSIYPN